MSSTGITTIANSGFDLTNFANQVLNETSGESLAITYDKGGIAHAFSGYSALAVTQETPVQIVSENIASLGASNEDGFGFGTRGYTTDKPTSSLDVG